MSKRSVEMPRRSCLSVPGSSAKMLAKATGVACDMAFIDLEDSVAPNEKAAARGEARRAIHDLDWGDRVLCIRVNAWDSPWTLADLTDLVAVAGARVDTVMLP